MKQVTRRLVLVAMVFAVGMTFIDQTIVAIAIPNIQRELSLSSTGSQWVVNGYTLALAALFALGGRLGDVLGRRRMVVAGVIGFAVASAACGLTPKGELAEVWIIVFRIVQGASAALMFPAAVATVVAAYPVERRGRAMAIFFGVAGLLTAVGPIAGGYLTQWTWRSIFWINVPIAVLALILIAISRPDDARRPAKIDYRGTVLITGAMGLIVLGLEQSSVWGWSNLVTWVCLLVGVALFVAFVSLELRTREPLIRVSIFTNRTFAIDTVVMGLVSTAFVPFFFFASVYAQVSLGESASNAGLYLLDWFIGYVIAAQVGGRLLDRRGIRPTIILGAALAAVAFFLLAQKLTDLSLHDQSHYIMFAGVGIGLMFGSVSTDAVNRAPSTSYSEATGITQTARNFGASLGLAILGAVLVSRDKLNVGRVLTRAGVSPTVAHRVAGSLSSESSGGGHESKELAHRVALAYAHSTQTVFYIMAGVFVLTFLVSVVGYPRSMPAQATVSAARGEEVP